MNHKTIFSLSKQLLSWTCFVSAHGYEVFVDPSVTRTRLTGEDRPYGILLSHLKSDRDSPFPKVAIAETVVGVPGCQNEWITAVLWRIPGDPIRTELKPRDWGSIGVFLHKFPVLYRDFAETEPTFEGITRFVSSYGFLGQNTYVVEDKDGLMRWGESMQEWVSEIHKMRLLQSLWKQIQERAEGKVFETYVERPQADKARFRSERWGFWEPESGRLDENFDLRYLPPERDKDGIPYRMAKTVFDRTLRRAIRQTCNVDFELVNDPQIELHPKGLLGAMYLQFLDEVLGGSPPLKRCPSCGEYFRAEHRSRVYCEPKCRQKMYRLNKEAMIGN